LLTLVVYLTVGISIAAHGISAAPLAARYGRWFSRHPKGRAPAMESAPSDVTRPRHRLGSAASSAVEDRRH